MADRLVAIDADAYPDWKSEAINEATADTSAGKQVGNCSCEIQNTLNLSQLTWYALLVVSDKALHNRLSATRAKEEGPAGWQTVLHPGRIAVIFADRPETEITCRLRR